MSRAHESFPSAKRMQRSALLPAACGGAGQNRRFYLRNYFNDLRNQIVFSAFFHLLQKSG